MSTREAATGLLLLCCSTAAVGAAPAGQCDPVVSLAELVAHPAAHQGEVLWVIASVSTGLENWSACFPDDDREIAHCLWVDIDDASPRGDQDFSAYLAREAVWRRWDRQTLAINATFDSAVNGHFGMWPGGLRNVSEIVGHHIDWSFTSRPAMPRNPCAPALPEETSSEMLDNGNADGAIAALSRELERAPDNASLLLRRGVARERNADYTGAIADYTRAIETSPKQDNGHVFWWRGRAKEAIGDIDGAILDYSRAIEIAPDHEPLYRSRALARKKAGDRRGAAADLARAERLNRGH